ncbi:hypothetical protein ACFLYO_11700 [Chloroflexota bacterium]
MNIQRRNSILVSLLVVTVIASFSIAVVSAEPPERVSRMETCAGHGLGPNFAYTEGPDSPLSQCLDSGITTRVLAAVIPPHELAFLMESCASHGLGPNFAYAEGGDSALSQCLDRIVAARIVSDR